MRQMQDPWVVQNHPRERATLRGLRHKRIFVRLLERVFVRGVFSMPAELWPPSYSGRAYAHPAWSHRVSCIRQCAYQRHHISVFLGSAMVQVSATWCREGTPNVRTACPAGCGQASLLFASFNSSSFCSLSNRVRGTFWYHNRCLLNFDTARFLAPRMDIRALRGKLMRSCTIGCATSPQAQPNAIPSAVASAYNGMVPCPRTVLHTQTTVHRVRGSVTGTGVDAMSACSSTTPF